MGMKKQFHSKTNSGKMLAQTERTYWFEPREVIIAEEPGLGKIHISGTLGVENLAWLIDLMDQAGEAEALKRAARSIRAFHEIHIGAGTLGDIERIAGRTGAAGADVLGLGLSSQHRLEIVHDDQHGIAGLGGNLTYAVLWSKDEELETWRRITQLSDLREALNR